MENKMKELKIQDALEYTKSIINTVPEPLIILYEDLRVALANRSFYRAFKVKPRETEGRLIYDLGNRQWNIPKLQELLEDILPKTTSFDDFEVEHDFPDLGKRIMLLNACRIYLEANRTKLIILTIEDITERKKIEGLRKKIRALEARETWMTSKSKGIAAVYNKGKRFQTSSRRNRKMTTKRRGAS